MKTPRSIRKFLVWTLSFILFMQPVQGHAFLDLLLAGFIGGSIAGSGAQKAAVSATDAAFAREMPRLRAMIDKAIREAAKSAAEKVEARINQTNIDTAKADILEALRVDPNRILEANTLRILGADSAGSTKVWIEVFSTFPEVREALEAFDREIPRGSLRQNVREAFRNIFISTVAIGTIRSSLGSTPLEAWGRGAQLALAGGHLLQFEQMQRVVNDYNSKVIKEVSRLYQNGEIPEGDLKSFPLERLRFIQNAAQILSRVGDFMQDYLVEKFGGERSIRLSSTFIQAIAINGPRGGTVSTYVTAEEQSRAAEANETLRSEFAEKQAEYLKRLGDVDFMLQKHGALFEKFKPNRAGEDQLSTKRGWKGYVHATPGDAMLAVRAALGAHIATLENRVKNFNMPVLEYVEELKELKENFRNRTTLYGFFHGITAMAAVVGGVLLVANHTTFVPEVVEFAHRFGWKVSHLNTYMLFGGAIVASLINNVFFIFVGRKASLNRNYRHLVTKMKEFNKRAQEARDRIVAEPPARPQLDTAERGFVGTVRVDLQSRTVLQRPCKMFWMGRSPYAFVLVDWYLPSKVL